MLNIILLTYHIQFRRFFTKVFLFRLDKPIGEFKTNESRFSTWLYRVSLNTALVYRRNKNRRNTESLGEEVLQKVDGSSFPGDGKVALIVAAIVHISRLQILALIGVMFLMMAGNLIYSGKLYQKIKRKSEFSHNTRTVLINYYNGVVRNLRVERVWVQFAIPLGLVAVVFYKQLLDAGSFGLMVFEYRTWLITGILPSI